MVLAKRGSRRVVEERKMDWVKGPPAWYHLAGSGVWVMEGVDFSWFDYIGNLSQRGRSLQGSKPHLGYVFVSPSEISIRYESLETYTEYSSVHRHYFTTSKWQNH